MEPGPRYRSLLAGSETRCVPISVTFEITLGCNLRCVHCYNFDRSPEAARGPERGEPLGDPEIHRVIDEVRAEGGLFLAFTGGEPTAHPSLPEFIAHAAGAGYLVRLKTNGLNLDAERVRRFTAAGLRAVDLSVYGATPDTHDRFVRREGAFEKTIAGARRARAAGLDVAFTFILNPANVGEAEAMMALAEQLGVRATADTHMTSRYDGDRSSLETQLSLADLETLYRGPLAMYVAGREGEQGSIACPCARSVCGVSSSGEVYPCIGAPVPAGNVRQAPFRTIWRESPVFLRIRSLRKESFAACSECEHARWCARSSGVMYSNTGDFTGPPVFGADLTCHEAALRHRLDIASRPA